MICSARRKGVRREGRRKNQHREIFGGLALREPFNKVHEGSCYVKKMPRRTRRDLAEEDEKVPESASKFAIPPTQ